MERASTSIAEQLPAGSAAWSNGASALARLDPGEGKFAFDRVTVGIVLSDQPKHRARYGDSKPVDLPLIAGQGWIFPAGIDGWCSWDASQSFLNVSVSAGVLKDAGLPSPSSLRWSAGALDPLLTQLALQLHAAERAPQLYRETLTLALGAQLARIAGAKASDTRVLDARLQRAADYVEDHLSEDVPIDTLASITALSPFHFARSFKKATGLSPHAYLVSRRLARARVLLATTKLAVAEIAWRVGYQDASRFTALFKRETGATPAAYRQARG